ncbi:MAG: TetR/AcrR family transcriptional regulator, partial [Woeseiaceae bacterium]
EPNTALNDIADEVDISPGNLHYHFRKKSDVVAALLAEFQADARRVLQPAQTTTASLDDFLVFLHSLLELKEAYAFLWRDVETLVVDQPNVGNALKHFARGLAATFELMLHGLVATGVLELDEKDMPTVARNLAVIALFADRFAALVGADETADDAALRIAAAVLDILRPLAAKDAMLHLEDLATHYGR